MTILVFTDSPLTVVILNSPKFRSIHPWLTPPSTVDELARAGSHGILTV